MGYVRDIIGEIRDFVLGDRSRAAKTLADDNNLHKATNAVTHVGIGESVAYWHLGQETGKKCSAKHRTVMLDIDYKHAF